MGLGWFVVLGLVVWGLVAMRVALLKIHLWIAVVEVARSAAEDHIRLKSLGFSRLTLVVFISCAFCFDA